MRPFVEISGVSLAYPGAGEGATLALDGISLSIERGAFVAVVGPSGCGKSTLLKLVSGLHLPSRGGVIVGDREVAGPIKIVGMDEVDLDKGHVSWISPIAKALLRAHEGDVVKMRTPAGVEGMATPP